MIKKLLIIIAVIAISSAAFAANVTFQWDTNDEPDLKGYRLWQSTTSGQYDQSQPPAFEVLVSNTAFDHTGDRCQWTLHNVPDGTYFWVLTAFDGANESDFSNEVTTTINSPPNAPKNLTIHVVVNVY